MRYLFEPVVTALPVIGSGLLYPVRRVWCVGRNYAAHAREMGGAAADSPFFFAKPADAVVPAGGRVPYPPLTQDLQHEVELVLAIGRAGAGIDAAAACEYLLGYAVGIDLTRRDLQAAARVKGQPWEMGKAFDRSAPVSPLRLAAEIGHPRQAAIRLRVNGTLRQDGDLASMIWPVPQVLAALSRHVELAPGDLVFTGTPAGVGPVLPGDRLHAEIEGVGVLDVEIAPCAANGAAT
jgi:fumarylpyruvate hydrolase